VIVVDDGSTDRSVEVIRGFGSRVQLVQQANQGPGAARNAGLAIATGEFVQFMDSDDLASRNKLAVQAAALERDGADLAYGPWAKGRVTTSGFEFADHVLQAAPLPASRTMIEWFLGGWSIVFQTCLLRRTLLQRVGTFRTDLRTWEDGEYLVRLLLAGAKLEFTPGCLTFYRLHQQAKLTSSGTTTSGRLRDRATALRQITRLLREGGGNLRGAARRDFQLGAWQLWREMHAAGSFNPGELGRIRELSLPAPRWLLNLRAFGQRLALRWRWQSTGARWIAPYQSRLPQAEDLALARELVRSDTLPAARSRLTELLRARCTTSP
jgi:glycosyltransferase involved in cell wall biosynthesis